MTYPRMLALIGAIAYALAGGTALAAGPMPQPGEEDRGFEHSLVVDDDRAQCPRAAFTSINAAVAAARPGDTIKVCPGVYNESVLVPIPNLALRGSTSGSSTEPCLRNEPATDPTRDSVVNGQIRLAANAVTLERFTIEFPGQPAFTHGIVTSEEFSGYRIIRNVVQNNSGGIDLRANGTVETVVRNNCIRANTQAQSNEGIFSAQGMLHNATIESNTFTQNRLASMFLGHGLDVFPRVTDPSTNLTVSNNVIVDDGRFGIWVSNVDGIDVTNNRIVRTEEGIDILSPASNARVERNRLEESGIRVDGDAFGCCEFSQSPSNVTIAHNTIEAAPLVSILMSNASGNMIAHNKIDDTGTDGIVVLRSQRTLVTSNHVTGSGLDGIRNSVTASNNTYIGNHMRDNAEHDAHDNARAANTWLNNKCETDFPAGTICGVK